MPRAKLGFKGRPVPQHILSWVTGARVHYNCYLLLSNCQPTVFDLLP